MKPPTPHALLADPAASDWLKAALRSALTRDPVDAANDAAVLSRVLNEHASQSLADLAAHTPPGLLQPH
ncbi:hypothetical protein [Azospirillum canadense]|uniref:hypothetical protein n=1 Tax=Azospirillum canadense TaxID=403962 RepID=UPI002227F3B4|nr:hypothetical protein [Azospirillum canadense]MCW2240688.1 hypothetical protein [Azospirillum canadense]